MKSGLSILTAVILGAWASASAETVSRVADLRSFAENKSSGNWHASAASDGKWAYFLVNEYGKFHSSQTDRTNWSKAFRSPQFMKLPQTAPFRFEKRRLTAGKDGKNFEQYRYNVEKESILLYWNRNGENPNPDLKGAAVIAEFTVPQAGNYSIQGELKWEQYAGAEMKQAAYEIGVLRSNGAFVSLFFRSFPATEKRKELLTLADFSKAEKLQNIRLESDDKLCFIIAGPRSNYRGVKVYDESVKIVSDTRPVRRQNASGKMMEKLDPSAAAPELAVLLREKKNGKAFQLYKENLLKRISGTPEIKTLYFWLHGPADADALLQGILTTRQYGKFEDSKSFIGLPGEVRWFAFPANGYNLLVRDIATMQWTNKLAVKYRETGDAKYLNAWLDYWADFAANWPRLYQKVRNDKIYLEKLPQRSIQWCDIPLYLGWRMQAFLEGLNALSRRPEAASLLDNEKFAAVLLHMSDYEAATAIRQLTTKEWLPNQRQHCAIELFLLGTAFYDLRDAAKWRKTALEHINSSGILPDGSDMEQSFNYNADLPKKIADMMTAAQQLPESERNAVTGPLGEIYRNRYYFLHSLAKPNGALPIAGKNNTWRDYRKPRQAMPGLSHSAEFYPGSNEPRNRSGLIQDFSNLPLSRQIGEYVYDRKGTPPAFHSIVFPFGGWSVLRSSWRPEALYAFMKNSRPGNGHWREGVNGLEIDAYGQSLLVNSGGEMYHPDPRMKEYWNATVAHNSISVDGFGQKVKLDAKIPRTYPETIGTRFLAGKEFDYTEGRYTGKYAGWNFHRDGMNVTQFDRQPYTTVISDVAHFRSVTLVRSANLFVIIDEVNSREEHSFTQSWLFAPEFSPTQMKIAENCVVTERPDSVNAALYFFGVNPLKFSSFYGVQKETQILGWVARLEDREKMQFTPAIQLLADWKSRGTQKLYTVIVPFRGENPVAARRDLPDGFELTLKNGEKITMSNGVLTTKYGVLSETGEKTPSGWIPMLTPRNFHWKQSEQGVVPSYE